MKKKLFAAMIGLLVLCLLVTGAMGATATSPVASHNWGEWEIVEPATCKSTGIKMRRCTDAGCLETEREVIPQSSDHTWGDWETTKAATCDEAGIQTRTCSVCGTQEQRATSKSDNHTWGDWKVTK